MAECSEATEPGPESKLVRIVAGDTFVYCDQCNVHVFNLRLQWCAVHFCNAPYQAVYHQSAQPQRSFHLESCMGL